VKAVQGDWIFPSTRVSDEDARRSIDAILPTGLAIAIRWEFRKILVGKARPAAIETLSVAILPHTKVAVCL
jgi:hypothetical protein